MALPTGPGRPAAKLVPVTVTEISGSLDSTYAELVEQGQLSRMNQTDSVRDQNGMLYVRTMFVYQCY